MQNSSNYKLLVHLLQKYARPSTTLLTTLMEHIIVRSYEAKEVFLHRDEVQSRICLLIEGAAIAVKNIRGERQLWTLWQQDELILHAPSSVQIAKSQIEIIFLCPSKTLEIPTKALYLIREQIPEMAHYFDKFLATDIEKLEQYTDWLRYTSRKDRVRDFKDRYPQHQYLLTQAQKAQYLGMSERWYKKIISEL